MKDLVDSSQKPFLDEVLKNTSLTTLSEWITAGMAQDEAVQRICKNIPNACDSLIKEASEDYLKYMIEHMYEASAQYRQEDNVFMARQEQKWGKCFAASETLYTLVLEVAQDFINYVSHTLPQEDREQRDYVYSAMVYIHGRACQVYLEILCLIKNGFADAAYARWRTMYELCFISDFIEQAGEDTAKAYLEQSNTDEQHPVWAKHAPCFADKGSKYKPTLNDIKANCDFSKKWVEEYKSGCFVTHGSPQGTVNRMSLFKNGNIIPVGKSDYGIAEPAINAAYILVIITVNLITVFPTIECIARSKMLMGWSHFLEEQYAETHEELFSHLYNEEEV